MDWTPGQDVVILQTPLQVWIMAIKKNIDEAKNANEVANALYNGLQLVLRKDKLEKENGSQPLEQAIKIPVTT